MHAQSLTSKRGTSTVRGAGQEIVENYKGIKLEGSLNTAGERYRNMVVTKELNNSFQDFSRFY